MIIDRFQLERQYYGSDCGIACIKMICNYYHISCSETEEYYNYVSKDGLSIKSLINISHKLNFETSCGRVDFQSLLNSVTLPCILFWDKKHFVVLYKIKETHDSPIMYIADPANKKYKCDKSTFLKHWLEKNGKGIIIMLLPKCKIKKKAVAQKGITFRKIVAKYKAGILWICLELLAGALIQLVIPFLTKKIVDNGIDKNNINVVIVILVGQFFLIIGKLLNDFFRKKLILNIGSLFSAKLLLATIKKLNKLPVRFFESRQTGDMLQRIQDNNKIERFLTIHFANMIFSLSTIGVLSIVLSIYSPLILLAFIIGSFFYILFASYFVLQKKQLNYSLFAMKSENQSRFLEMVEGVYEIKLNNNWKKHECEIASIQNKIFKLNKKSFSLDQGIEFVDVLINGLKNLIITFISAQLVIENKFTLGTMLSVQYIIGEMNVPINQFITCINGYQDAKFSLNRINNIFHTQNEGSGKVNFKDISAKTILLKNLFFNYIQDGDDVIKGINIELPLNKTIAIVGSSGSGKSTLIKLLMKFYNPSAGYILFGNTNLADINTNSWRENCGAVMQEGILFSDSIKNNIIMNNCFDENKFNEAVKIANVDSFVHEFRNKYDTLIGPAGQKLSRGQTQRILIARIIYKDPKIFFFDEATNALDSKNEKNIITSLKPFLANRTTFIVAHRLSTIRNADLILVIEHGQIVEKGTHEELIQLKGYYFQLIKNQL